jgi:hypothetical protein
MDEWLSYRPADFLLFGPEAYSDLFAQGNLAFWPLIPVFLGLGAALLVFHRLGPLPRQLALVGLAAAWGWVGWDFFATRYGAINWAAPALAPVMALQAVILLAVAALMREPRWSRGGVVLITYAVFVHPLWPLLTGRPIVQAEILGLAPDPTAIATLGVALMVRRGVLVAILPALWLALGATTLLTMGVTQALAPVTALAVWSGAMLARWHAGGQPPRNALR